MKKLVLQTAIFVFLLFVFNVHAQEVNDIAPCGNKLFAATDKGIYEITDNGKTFSKISNADGGKYHNILSSGSSILAYKLDTYLVSNCVSSLYYF